MAATKVTAIYTVPLIHWTICSRILTSGRASGRPEVRRKTLKPVPTAAQQAAGWRLRMSKASAQRRLCRRAATHGGY